MTRLAIFIAGFLVHPAQGFAADFAKGDEVCICMSGIPVPEQSRINGTYKIGNDGMLLLPLIGPLKAGGLSPGKLGVAMEDAYKEAGIFVHPSVEAKPAGPGRGCGPAFPPVNACGNVRKPGPITFVASMTVKQAIELAGGRDEFGGRHLKLFRNGKARMLDYRNPEHLGLSLQPGDTLQVLANDEELWSHD